MKNLTTSRFPNLFDLVLSQTGPRGFSLPAFFLTYVLLPLMITIAVVTAGVILPGSKVAAVFLFLAIAYANGFIAFALALALPKVTSKKRTQAHILISSSLPFALWYISVLLLFGY